MKEGHPVNLERAMLSTTRFGGHFVQGHVDCTVSIADIILDPPNSVIFTFRVSKPEYMKFIVAKGYVCLDGTSLTVIDVSQEECTFRIMLIEYTQSRVILTAKKVGERVNLEVDQIGKVGLFNINFLILILDQLYYLFIFILSIHSSTCSTSKTL